MDMYEVIVVGAGPAGCMLAQTAGKRCSVLLVESRDLHVPIEDGKEKSCGGLLNPTAQEVLAKLGLALPKEVLETPQVFAIRAIDYDTNQERYYPKHYINIRRGAFDRWMLSEALLSPRVDLCDRTTVVSYTPYETHVEVTLREKNGTVRQVKTRYLIGADGAASLVRRHLEQKYCGPDEPRFPIRRYVSLQQWFTVEEEMPYYVALFDQRITDYYSWMIPKAGHIILGAAIPEGKNVRGRFQYLKHRVRASGFSLGEPVQEQGAILLRPYGPGSVYLGKGRVFLVGEAAGFISASSEEGISYALSSGTALGEALLYRKTPEETENLYRKRVFKLRWGLAAKAMKSVIMYSPKLRGAVFRSGLLSMDVK